MNAILYCKLHCTIELDLSGAFKLTLITDEVDADVLIGVRFDLSEPVLYIFKSLVASDIVGKEHAMSSPVENPSHRLE